MHCSVVYFTVVYCTVLHCPILSRLVFYSLSLFYLSPPLPQFIYLSIPVIALIKVPSLIPIFLLFFLHFFYHFSLSPVFSIPSTTVTNTVTVTRTLALSVTVTHTVTITIEKPLTRWPPRSTPHRHKYRYTHTHTHTFSGCPYNQYRFYNLLYFILYITFYFIFFVSPCYLSYFITPTMKILQITIYPFKPISVILRAPIACFRIRKFEQVRHTVSIICWKWWVGVVVRIFRLVHYFLFLFFLHYLPLFLPFFSFTKTLPHTHSPSLSLTHSQVLTTAVCVFRGPVYQREHSSQPSLLSLSQKRTFPMLLTSPYVMFVSISFQIKFISFLLIFIFICLGDLTLNILTTNLRL